MESKKVGYHYYLGVPVIKGLDSLPGSGIPAFENVANMDQLPTKGAHVIALPMKIKNGSGSLLRLIVWLPGK